ncbi:Nn.00g115390.m01.CDS01 [Neocucurbitaria sp. VM-36]
MNYNPFARTRSRDSQGDIENPVYRTKSTRSENHATPAIEEQRRLESREAEKEFGAPNHHNTEPSAASPTYAGTSSTIPESSTEKGTIPKTNGALKDSSDSTVVGSSRQNSHGPTKRAKFRTIFRKEHEGDEGAELDRVESEQLSLEERKRKAHKRKIPVGAQIRFVLFGAWINVLLIMVPVGFAVYYAHLAPVPVFIINFVAIIPLAAMLSSATEELAIRVGETLGGLLNATFGNAVELIVSVQALIKNEITIVKTSLIGSMLSNLLLVLGMSFFLGGINRLEQFFNVTVAQTAASLLALCIASLIIPTVFHNMIAEDNITEGDAAKNQELSRGTAVILLVVYACYLGFQLKTHSSMYNAPSQKVPKRKSGKKEEGDANRGIAAIGAGTAAASGGGVNVKSLFKNPDNSDDEEEEEFETPSLSVIGALVTLGLSTTLVAFCSEFMVSSIDGLTETGGVSTTFVGLILLPIVGNAAEHATAVTVAIKDKMDLSIGVAVGSSMQIALLVFPLIVILGWILGKDCMTLYFDTFQIATLFVSVLLVNYLIQDGKSHWLEGVLLMASYIIIALAAWFYPNIEENQC